MGEGGEGERGKGERVWGGEVGGGGRTGEETGRWYMHVVGGRGRESASDSGGSSLRNERVYLFRGGIMSKRPSRVVAGQVLFSLQMKSIMG
jgi:hypothetical protein